MNIEKNLIDDFKKFMGAEFGAKMEKSKFKGETGRFVVKGNRFIIVREHFPRRSADSVEVFCSDKDLLNRIEALFYSVIERQIDRETVDDEHEDGLTGKSEEIEG